MGSGPAIFKESMGSIDHGIAIVIINTSRPWSDRRRLRHVERIEVLVKVIVVIESGQVFSKRVVVIERAALRTNTSDTPHLLPCQPALLRSLVQKTPLLLREDLSAATSLKRLPKASEKNRVFPEDVTPLFLKVCPLHCTRLSLRERRITGVAVAALLPPNDRRRQTGGLDIDQ